MWAILIRKSYGINHAYALCAAGSAVVVKPGPSMLLGLNKGGNYGMKIARYGFVGGVLADLVPDCAVGCGLGALLQASEALFNGGNVISAPYLIYLAW
mgnify:CR=1 FL=1